MGKKLEQAIAVLNGAVGDYLARTGNGLATPMTLVHDGRPLPVERAALAAAYPTATRRAVVLAHGLMCSESIFDFPPAAPAPPAADYGARLAADHGYTPLYLRYNSGLAIADNGAALAVLLEDLIDAWPTPTPLDEILLLGFSMGGLVARAACHVAATDGHRWLPRVRRAIYVGTPHRGAPLERYGRVLTKLLRRIDDPYTQLAAQLGDLRSDGVKDLGDADLRHQDRARRVARIALRDPQHPVPLLPTISHYLVAGTISPEPWLAALFGDSIVPLPSATNGAADVRTDVGLLPDHIRILPGVAHMTLAHHAGVYEHIRTWSRP